MGNLQTHCTLCGTQLITTFYERTDKIEYTPRGGAEIKYFASRVCPHYVSGNKHTGGWVSYTGDHWAFQGWRLYIETKSELQKMMNNCYWLEIKERPGGFPSSYKEEANHPVLSKQSYNPRHCTNCGSYTGKDSRSCPNCEPRPEKISFVCRRCGAPNQNTTDGVCQYCGSAKTKPLMKSLKEIIFG